MCHNYIIIVYTHTPSCVVWRVAKAGGTVTPGTLRVGGAAGMVGGMSTGGAASVGERERGGDVVVVYYRVWRIKIESVSIK